VLVRCNEILKFANILTTTTTYTEQALVIAIKEKDRTAFAHLYKSYAAIIFGTINRIIADKELAEDTMQEVFVKIWDNIHQYDVAKGRLFTWMINLTRNYSIDVLRSKAYRNQKMIKGTEETVHHIKDEAIQFDKLDKLAFQKTISNLNEKQQQVINLVYFQGYNQEEVSKILEIPLGTVKSRIRLAVSELRKIMQKN
jgi:RNA polymerase sigma factor (sigma-70 family)